jgi:hypothetical protein
MPVMQGDVDDVYPASAHRLDQDYGQLGLRRAADIYSEPQNRDAIAILILKGGAALQPCRRADIAAK